MLTFFAHCYQPTVTAVGAVDWQRVALPYAGGVADQPAWLLEALEFVRAATMRLAADRAREQRPSTRTRARGAREKGGRERQR